MTEPDSVLPFIRPPSTQQACGRCGKFIERGERFHEVRAPQGLVPVHVGCMAKGER